MSIYNTLFYISVYFFMFLTLSNAVSVSKPTITYDYLILTQSYDRLADPPYNVQVKLFSQNVTKHLNSGWELGGNLIFDRGTGFTHFLIQPLVKKTIININEW